MNRIKTENDRLKVRTEIARLNSTTAECHVMRVWANLLGIAFEMIKYALKSGIKVKKLRKEIVPFDCKI